MGGQIKTKFIQKKYIFPKSKYKKYYVLEPKGAIRVGWTRVGEELGNKFPTYTKRS